VSTTPTQSEADALLAMEKLAADQVVYVFPYTGGKIVVPLESRDKRESFLMSVNRKRIVLTTSYQTRARGEVVLARLDFAAPHRNPDGEEIGVPHLHLYREGAADQWAIAVPEGILSDETDGWQVLQDFMRFCNVVEKPNIVQELLK